MWSNEVYASRLYYSSYLYHGSLLPQIAWIVFIPHFTISERQLIWDGLLFMSNYSEAITLLKEAERDDFISFAKSPSQCSTSSVI